MDKTTSAGAHVFLRTVRALSSDEGKKACCCYLPLLPEPSETHLLEGVDICLAAT